MTLDEFRASLAESAAPAGLSPPLQALWFDGNGDWDAAHGCVQGEADRAAAWVHAYLHRKEGDPGNAAYWYSRAGRPVPSAGLDDEWGAIVGELLGG